MLFEKLLHAISSIIEFFARLVLFLFKVLGLWIPAIYSLAFVLFCAIFQLSFNDLLAVFLVGLALSVILAFYVMFLKVINERKRKYMKKQERRIQRKARKEAKEEEKRKREDSVAREEQMIIKPPKKVETQETQVPVMEQLKEEKYQPYQSPVAKAQENVDRTMQSYPPLQFNAEPPQYVPRPENSVTITKPKIFKTRMDPNLLIYEYSDRLVFYKKTLNGLEHVKTERKNPNNNY